MGEIFNLEELNYPYQQQSQHKILIVTDYFDASYYYTFYYPLVSLSTSFDIVFSTVSKKEISEQTQLQEPQQFCQNLLITEKPNYVIFSRYALPHGRILLDTCKNHRIPTAYFIDDDLINIPDNLDDEIQQRQGNEQVILERKYLLENVDLVYTSTEFLSQHFAQYFPNQYFIYGTYPTYLDFLLDRHQYQELKHRNHKFTFGYMGTKGHQKDLEMIAPVIAQVLTDYPEVKFETFGSISLPNQLAIFSDQVFSHPVANCNNFLQYLYDLGWNLGLAPLENTDFNKCKSPGKYLEYTACGIPTIASDILVYNGLINQENGVLVAPDQWYENIIALIKSPNQAKNLVQKAQLTCAQEFQLAKVTQQFIQVLAILDSRSNLALLPPQNSINLSKQTSINPNCQQQYLSYQENQLKQPLEFNNVVWVDQINIPDLPSKVRILQAHQSELHALINELQNHKIANLQQVVMELQTQRSRLKQEVKKLNRENKQLKATVTGMKSSKFWKFRQAWIKFKKMLAKS